jgi:hypothetical protein
MLQYWEKRKKMHITAYIKNSLYSNKLLPNCKKNTKLEGKQQKTFTSLTHSLPKLM